MTGFSVKTLTVAGLAVMLGAALIGCSHQAPAAPPAPPPPTLTPQQQAYEDMKSKSMAAMHANQPQAH